MSFVEFVSEERVNVNGASRFYRGANEMAKYPMYLYLKAGEDHYSGKKDQINFRFQ